MHMIKEKLTTTNKQTKTKRKQEEEKMFWREMCVIEKSKLIR